MVNSTEEGSMGKSQPTYTKEFKQQAVKLFETSGKSKTPLEILEFLIAPKVSWCKEFGEHGQEKVIKPL
jgi:transposase